MDRRRPLNRKRGDTLDEFPVRLRRLRETMWPVRSMEVTGGLMGLKTPGMLRLYERVEADPNKKASELIADYYCVSIDYLVGRTDCPFVKRL